MKDIDPLFADTDVFSWSNWQVAKLVMVDSDGADEAVVLYLHSAVTGATQGIALHPDDAVAIAADIHAVIGR